VYLVIRLPWLSLRLSPQPEVDQPWRSFSSFLFFSTGLYSGLVVELSQLFQLHELGGSSLKLVQVGGRLHVEVIDKHSWSQGRWHVVHGHIRAQVSDVHIYLSELP